MTQPIPQPNLIVFRIPDDEDGNKTFLEVGIDPDGSLNDNAQSFSVLNGDSYNLLEFHEIVLAQRDIVDGVEGSYELVRVGIYDAATKAPAVLHEVMEDIQEMVTGLIEEYNEQPVQ